MASKSSGTDAESEKVVVPTCEKCKKSLLKCTCDNDLAKKIDTDLEK